MLKKTCLIEIGTEEIPAKILSNVALSFYKNTIDTLQSYNIEYKTINLFFTPRRIALKIEDIKTLENTIKIKNKGPSITRAFDSDGNITNIANKWMQYHKIHINQTKRLKNKKGEWLVYIQEKKRKNIKCLLPKIIEDALEKITFKNKMTWLDSTKQFYRPIRNIVMLLNDQVISGKIFNVQSSNFLQSHISIQKKIKISHAHDYPLILFKYNNIIADYNLRKNHIIKEINQLVQNINGSIDINNNLINEITSLVESPCAFLSTFHKKFLTIPRKILIYIIEKQQKCLSVCDKNKKMLPYFIFISNIHPVNSNKVILGNETVMNSRLSDAQFFISSDRKIKLKNYLSSLKNVMFQHSLGSLYSKTLRIQSIMVWIASFNKVNIENAKRVAMLSKCDLITHMVSEFPQLQGTIGMYYALEDKEKKEICTALKEQYLPASSKDKTPLSILGSLLSISDKIDTISGFFLVGKYPSANKDPFALRRLAIGVIRIIINNNILLNFRELINKSIFLNNNQKNINFSSTHQKIVEFFMTRLLYWYEEQKININVIKSVLSLNSIDFIDINKKINALSLFQKSNYSKIIILSIKRISSILEKNNKIIIGEFNLNLIQKEEEKQLFLAINKLLNNTHKLFLQSKYDKILLEIKNISEPIKNFFEKVQIHDSNALIELNRLRLLTKIKNFFFKITDFSYFY